MGYTEIVLTVTLAAVLALIFLVIFNRGAKSDNTEINRLKEELLSTYRQIGDIVSENQKSLGELQTKQLMLLDEKITQKQDSLQTVVTAFVGSNEQRFKTFASENSQQLEQLRQTMERRLLNIQSENSEKLEKMRGVVEEKLDDKLSKSFSSVDKQLEQVYLGLGEMKSIAGSVSDLKKVMSGVKTRGIFGESQLKSILTEILSSSQYEENAVTVPGSKNPVEFAVKLPAENGGFIFLPIDAKLPGDSFFALQSALDNGDTEETDRARKALITVLKKEAKSIKEKYVQPPYTTDFAVMFLPFESLYIEAISSGTAESIQHDFNIAVTGPSTMAAFLNALNMGFRTLDIKERTDQMWELLKEVRTEFEKFADSLNTAQNKLTAAYEEIDRLVGVRTRQLRRKLSEIDGR